MPLRFVLVVPFVLQIFGAVGLTAYLSLRNGQQAIDKLVDNEQQKVGDRAESHARAYTRLSHQFLRNAVASVDAGTLDLDDFEALQRYLLAQSLATPSARLLHYTSADGRFLAVERAATSDGSGGDRRTLWTIAPGDGERELRRTTLEPATAAAWPNLRAATEGLGSGAVPEGDRPAEKPGDFSPAGGPAVSDRSGENPAPVDRAIAPDPRETPAYRAAVAAGRARWSSAPNLAAIAAGSPDPASQPGQFGMVQPLYDRAGNLQGVLGIALDPRDISQFLSELQVGESGRAFAIDRAGNLLAHSAPEVAFLDGARPEANFSEANFSEANVFDWAIASLPSALDSPDPISRAAVRRIQQRFGDFDNLQQVETFTAPFDGDRLRVQVQPLRDDRGLDWLTVVVLAESDFTESIRASTRNTILLCFLALALSVVLSVIIARWIAKPILRLNEAARAVAAGDLTWQVAEFRGVEEMETLAAAFNRMVQRLKDSFEELEIRVELRTFELREALEAADEARNHATAANRAKSEFLANMSHELRTPLNGILGYAQILQRDRALSPAQQRAIETIHQCGNHLLVLIEDVLDLSKIEARKMELCESSFSLVPFLEGVSDICRIRAEQKGIEFAYAGILTEGSSRQHGTVEGTADRAAPLEIRADEKRLRQVLLNLLGNAIKFTDRGRVTLRVTLLEGPEDRSADRGSRAIASSNGRPASDPTPAVDGGVTNGVVATGVIATGVVATEGKASDPERSQSIAHGESPVGETNSDTANSSRAQSDETASDTTRADPANSLAVKQTNDFSGAVDSNPIASNSETQSAEEKPDPEESDPKNSNVKKSENSDVARSHPETLTAKNSVLSGSSSTAKDSNLGNSSSQNSSSQNSSSQNSKLENPSSGSSSSILGRSHLNVSNFGTNSRENPASGTSVSARANPTTSSADAAAIATGSASRQPLRRLRFEVEDTGIGIDADHLQRIFLPFEQAGDRDAQARGTGLGLAISQRIVQLMGSHIHLDSQVGRGSRFWFDLEVPVASLPPSAAIARRIQQKIADTGAIVGYEGPTRTILVVDDRPENCTLVAAFLEPLTFRVIAATGGREALDCMAAEAPDLVLLDLAMPEIGGLDVLDRVRDDPALAVIPIAVASANAFAGERERALAAGAVAFLAKPLQADELLACLQQQLHLTWTRELGPEAAPRSRSVAAADSRLPEPAAVDTALETRRDRAGTEGTASEVLPPAETLQALADLARRGNLNRIQQQLDAIAAERPECEPFVTRARALARSFQVRPLRAFLDGAIASSAAEGDRAGARKNDRAAIDRAAIDRPASDPVAIDALAADAIAPDSSAPDAIAPNSSAADAIALDPIATNSTATNSTATNSTATNSTDPSATDGELPPASSSSSASPGAS